MNIEDYINAAEVAMIRQTDHSYYRYALVVRAEKLLCIAAAGLITGDVRIDTITRYQLEHGLTSAEWTRIGDKIMKVYKELRL